MFPYKNISVEIFGESHSEEIGVKLNGIKEGCLINLDNLQSFLDERKAGNNPWSTPRKEEDKIIILSGIKDGKSTGEEIFGIIKNTNIKAKDYDNVQLIPRPSHADYVQYVKYGKISTGGGKYSGRMTAPLCIAGGIALQILESKGIKIGAYVSSIGNVKGDSYIDRDISYDEIIEKKNKGEFSLSKYNEMVSEVISARERGDSVGGAIECIVYNLPIGLGDALYDGMEGRISASVFAVPAVKSVEFGLGKDFSFSYGSRVNDLFIIDNNKIKTKTNNNGGINGGITNGMPLTMRVTIKPTPSITIPQKSVNLTTMEECELHIKGRHDSCIVPRALSGIKSAVALTILDSLLDDLYI